MRVTVFNGSPRAEKSNTHIIANAFLKGAKTAGAETENIFLIEKDINHCRGCFTCWFKTPGKCIYQDDMIELLELYLSSDVIVFGTPVYTWNMTACLKNFADRLIPLRSPMIQESEGNFDMKTKISEFPDTVVIVNSGFPGEKNFGLIHEVFRSSNPILEIYRNSGHLLKMDRSDVKAKVDAYLKTVEKGGFELVKSGKVSIDVKNELDKDLVSAEEYVKILGM